MSPDPPDGLVDAFWAYEHALMNDDLRELDRLFAPGPATLRADATGLLVGHERISAFRGGRGGAPQREVAEMHVQAVDDEHALVMAVTALAKGGRGLQTQLWERGADGWRVTAAHVAVPPPAIDTRIWRVVGAPLMAGAAGGTLQGERLAVADSLAPDLVAATGEPRVAALLSAGADLVGIAATGSATVPNPAAPYRSAGGPLGGLAATVALGHATLGLGLDGAGDLLRAAAYQGLPALRTTTGCGLLARSASTLATAGAALPAGFASGGGGAEAEPNRAAEAALVVVPELMRVADADVAAAVTAWLPPAKSVESWDIAPEDLAAWLADQVLVVPTTTSSAPAVDADPAGVEQAEAVGDRLLALADDAGLPALTLPLQTTAGLPCGVSLIGAPGTEALLLRTGARLSG